MCVVDGSAWSLQAVNVVFQEAGSEEFTAEKKKAAGDARGHVTPKTNPQGDCTTTQQSRKNRTQLQCVLQKNNQRENTKQQQHKEGSEDAEDTSRSEVNTAASCFQQSRNSVTQ